jgi:glycosyltransferase involved in cell wall biosynthesis
LPEQGFDSVLVFGNCESDEANMEYLVKPGDRVERVPTLGRSISPVRDLLALVSLWKLMRRYRPDIVHTHTAKAGLLGRTAAWLAGCRCVIHTYHGNVLEGYFPRVFNYLLRGLERLLGSASDALCAVSEQQARELLDRFTIAEPDKVRVIPLGLELKRFQSLPTPNFFEANLRVCWLGRFVPIKNLELLVAVIAKAEAEGLPMEFVLAGEGPERPEILRRIERLGLRRVRILPWQDDVAGLLAESHLTILTSLREGTPLALIQAMAAGRPFLSTPAGGVVDLVWGVSRREEHSWWYENGVLCPADASAFVSVFRAMLSRRELLTEMGKAARDHAIANFSESRLTADIAKLYTALLAQQTQSASTSWELSR